MAVFAPLSNSRSEGRPAVVAHRGASRAARENTVEAFAKARALRADGVELDVRRSADLELVVHHDASVKGLGNLAERRFAQIRAHAPWIPTLAEAVEACSGMWVNVEVKNLPWDADWDPGERVAEAVASWVTAEEIEDRIIVSSFNPQALVRVREVAPALATALLVVGDVEPVGALAACAEAGHAALNPAVEVLAGDALAEAVEEASDAGVALVPWTVDDRAEITRLAGAGVDGVITNVPDVAWGAIGAPG